MWVWRDRDRETEKTYKIQGISKYFLLFEM